jgi:hypothetical protein
MLYSGLTVRATILERRPKQMKKGGIVFKLPVKKNTKSRLTKLGMDETSVSKLLSQDEITRQKFTHWG